MDGESSVPLLEMIGKFALFSAVVLITLMLWIVLGETPVGFLVASLISYSIWVFCFVFFRWRGMPEAYSLRNEKIRRRIPHLVGIHAAFLALVSALLSIAFYLQPRLRSGWVAQGTPTHRSALSEGLILACTLILVAQVYISRRLLNRSVRGS